MREMLVLKSTGMLKAAQAGAWRKGTTRPGHLTTVSGPSFFGKVPESRSSRRCKQERPVLSL